MLFSILKTTSSSGEKTLILKTEWSAVSTDKMNFPNVLGCIDWKHVQRQGPSEDEVTFVLKEGVP